MDSREVRQAMAHDSSPDLGQRPPSSDDLEKVSVSWLILQRLSDLTESVATLRKEQNESVATLRKEQTESVATLRKEHAESINALRTDMIQRFVAVDQRFDSIDRRFESIDHRFNSIDHRFESMERRFESMERRWMWALGLILVMALGLLAKLLLPGA